jgi:hypothetical protein
MADQMVDIVGVLSRNFYGKNNYYWKLTNDYGFVWRLHPVYVSRELLMSLLGKRCRGNGIERPVHTYGSADFNLFSISESHPSQP